MGGANGFWARASCKTLPPLPSHPAKWNLHVCSDKYTPVFIQWLTWDQKVMYSPFACVVESAPVIISLIFLCQIRSYYLRTLHFSSWNRVVEHLPMTFCLQWNTFGPATWFYLIVEVLKTGFKFFSWSILYIVTTESNSTWTKATTTTKRAALYYVNRNWYNVTRGNGATDHKWGRWQWGHQSMFQ